MFGVLIEGIPDSSIGAVLCSQSMTLQISFIFVDSSIFFTFFPSPQPREGCIYSRQRGIKIKSAPLVGREHFVKLFLDTASHVPDLINASPKIDPISGKVRICLVLFKFFLKERQDLRFCNIKPVSDDIVDIIEITGGNGFPRRGSPSVFQLRPP